MIHFKVSDEAVEAAENARVKCLNALTSYGSAGVDERHNMAMKVAIEAALPVMFEKCGVYTRSNHIHCTKQLHDIFTAVGKDVTVYRLKEPK